jgi:hypothetical protein
VAGFAPRQFNRWTLFGVSAEVTVKFGVELQNEVSRSIIQFQHFDFSFLGVRSSKRAIPKEQIHSSRFTDFAGSIHFR